MVGFVCIHLLGIGWVREYKLSLSSSIHLVGPSTDPSGINLVDCIKVYGKTKDAFGWLENGQEPPVHKSPLEGTKGVAAAGTEDLSKMTEEPQEYQPHASARHLSVMDK